MARISDEEFVMNFEDFVDTAMANKTVLNYSAEDQAEGNALKADLLSDLNAIQAAQATLDGLKATFSNRRKTASEFQNSRKKYFDSNPNTTDALRAELKINKPASGASIVAQPLNLSAEGFESGINKLKWERNGNPQHRNFTVEYRVGETGQWLIAGTTRKTTYNHKNQTPGVKIYYRVFANTDEEQSPHSNTAVVYA